MRIQEDRWRMWMEWKDRQDPRSPINRFPGACTIYAAPIERTENGIVTLIGKEIPSYRKFQRYIKNTRARIQNMKEKHRKQVENETRK
jgi:hypothetical protein